MLDPALHEQEMAKRGIAPVIQPAAAPLLPAAAPAVKDESTTPAGMSAGSASSAAAAVNADKAAPAGTAGAAPAVGKPAGAGAAAAAVAAAASAPAVEAKPEAEDKKDADSAPALAGSLKDISAQVALGKRTDLGSLNSVAISVSGPVALKVAGSDGKRVLVNGTYKKGDTVKVSGIPAFVLSVSDTAVIRVSYNGGTLKIPRAKQVRFKLPTR